MTQANLNIFVFGLSLSSSWGNGHATTWRALLSALARRGHAITFLERDVPWYRAHRDLESPSFCALKFYTGLADLDDHASELAAADLVIVGSYVPDGIEVASWIFRHTAAPVAFYDIDTPVTLANLEEGTCSYLDTTLIRRFDAYLSFTGGPILQHLSRRFGAKRPTVLYCSVDETAYRPQKVGTRYDIAYLGTYSADRQPVLERLLLEPARARPQARFAVAGSQYPDTISWPKNVERIDHLPPDRHPDFYSATRFALNVTRADMVRYGYCPSVRIFEAAACETAIISDPWQGLDTILMPGREVLIAKTSEDILKLLDIPHDARAAIAASGRAQILAAHTSARRAIELETCVMSLALDSRRRTLSVPGGRDVATVADADVRLG
jgi:spore maturation protein CgeB